MLDLFDGDKGVWTVDEMHRRLSYTRSTLYRYLKVLSDAELLTSLSGAGYLLGPRIVELDYRMRRRDPMIVAADPLMMQLADETRGIALLCRRYREKVLCIHQARVAGSGIQTTYERGKALPLFRGAASRVILANLSKPQVKRLYASYGKQFASAGIGSSFSEVQSTLKTISLRGWDLTAGQVTEGIAGVAAPIFDGEGVVIGSLSISMSDRKLSSARRDAITEKVVSGAKSVSKAIGRS